MIVQLEGYSFKYYAWKLTLVLYAVLLINENTQVQSFSFGKKVFSFPKKTGPTTINNTAAYTYITTYVGEKFAIKG